MNKNILFAILIFLVAQTMVWLQLNGQFVWDSFKKYEWILILFGLPISWIFLEATRQGVAGFGGLLWPQILKPLYVFWMLLANMLSWVNTRIILGVIFYLIFTPIALVMRIAQRDGLQKKINKNASSYWTQRTAPENIKEHFERQF